MASSKKVTKKIATEREYIINLRREILKVPRHKRTPKAIKAVKQFVAKHMRVPERNLNKIKIDQWLNQELWFRGIKNPVTKVKVRVKKDGENIRVELIDLPDKVNFILAREKKKQEASKKAKKTAEKKETSEEKKEPSEEEKAEEKEKKESAKEVKQQQAKDQAKTQKHTQSAKEQKSQPQRKALQK